MTTDAAGLDTDARGTTARGTGARGTEFQTADDLIRTSSYCSMVHVAGQLTHEVAPQLGRHDVTPATFTVLSRVLAHPGSTPAELARLCSTSPQNLAVLLERCERLGQVRRVGKRGRGRRTTIEITEAGQNALVACWPGVHNAGQDRLTGGQDQLLLALLDLLRQPPRTGDAISDDVVVLVDDQGTPVGTADRVGVHTTDTPLHLAFSTYLRRSDGRVLLTRRALHKSTWPGVWTNSACGHLRPGEDAEQASLRRVPQELGTAPTDLQMVLPDFRYRAVDASGLVENELCPVLVGSLDDAALQVDANEVCDVAWVQWADLRETAARMPHLLSPWCVLQVAAMGDDPWA